MINYILHPKEICSLFKQKLMLKVNEKCWYILIETKDSIVYVDTNVAQPVHSDLPLNPTAVIVDI